MLLLEVVLRFSAVKLYLIWVFFILFDHVYILYRINDAALWVLWLKTSG